jgi:hypothetical protein
VPKLCFLAALTFGLVLLHCAPSCLAQAGMDEFQRGTAAYGQKNYAVAIGHFTQAAQKGNVTATYYLALSYLGLKQEPKAIELFRHISKNFPNTSEADLANTYLGRLQQVGASASATPTGKSSGPTRLEPMSAADALKAKLENHLTEEQWAALPKSARIPFQMQNGHMHVQAKVKGEYLDIIFDTGASLCAVSIADHPNLFSKAELEKAPVIPIGRPHGVEYMRLVTGEVSVDKITRQCVIMLSREPGVSVIGQNFFKEYTYEIDGFYVRMSKAPYQGSDVASTSASVGGQVNAKSGKATESAGPRKLATQPGNVKALAVSESSKSNDKYTVPFIREKNCMIVEVMVNGKPTRTTFDTGCAPDGLVMPMWMVQPLGIQHNSDGFFAERAEIGPIIRKYARVNFANGLDCLLIGPKFFGDRPYVVDPVNSVIKFQY